MIPDAQQNERNEQLQEVLEVLDLDQLVSIARKLKVIMEQKHGEVVLVVKNCELAFIEKKDSEDVRKRKKPAENY